MKNVLNYLSKNKDLHSRFINSLSLLEYVGARKIIKSQKAESINIDILGHIAEEIRHSRVLKNIALKLSENKLQTYKPEDLLSGPSAWNYIQKIDHSVESDLGEKNSWLNYLYTTLLIEERAMDVYPLYVPILDEWGFGNSLKGMIIEEKNHLNFTRKHIEAEDPEMNTRLLRLKKVEENAFAEFMDDVRESLKPQALTSARDFESSESQTR